MSTQDIDNVRACLAALYHILSGLFRHRSINRYGHVWTSLPDGRACYYPKPPKDEQEIIRKLKLSRPSHWVKGGSHQPLPTTHQPVYWMVFAPDLQTGFRTGEWLYGENSLTDGGRYISSDFLLPGLLRKVVRTFFSRVNDVWQPAMTKYSRLLAESQRMNLPVDRLLLPRDQLVAATAGIVEHSLIELLAESFNFGPVSRMGHILGCIRRASQLTVERRHVCGGLVYSGDKDVAQACDASSRLYRFKRAFNWNDLHIRTFLKLLALTDGRRRFLVADEKTIQGVIQLASDRSVTFSDSPEFVDAVVAGRETPDSWWAPWPESMAVFRITGPGRGSVNMGPRRVVDVREGQLCFESAVAPLLTARAAARQAGCSDPQVLGSLLKVVGQLRSKGKGAIFILCPERASLAPILHATTIDFQVQAGPGRLTAQTVEMIADWASIDGAVVMTPAGVIESVGAILAPAPCAAERFEYGARHNSAIRISVFLGATNLQHAVITVSEDGFVSAFQGGDYVVPDFDSMVQPFV